jgi:O-antigen ligase
LDVLAQTGIIGIVLLGFSLISGLLVILFVRHNETGELDIWKWFAVYVTLGMSFYNLTESTFVRAGAGDWILFVAVFTSAVFSRGYSQAANSPLPRRTDRQFHRVYEGQL